MESNDKLKKLILKLVGAHGIIKIEDFDSDSILIDEKSYKNISVYNISCKSLIDFRFDKIDGFIRVCNGTRYLVLFGSEKYESICDKIKYFIIVRSIITYIISQNYATTKEDSYDSLSLEKTMTLRNVIILVKSVWYKDRNYYYHDIFFKKASDELPKK